MPSSAAKPASPEKHELESNLRNDNRMVSCEYLVIPHPTKDVVYPYAEDLNKLEDGFDDVMENYERYDFLENVSEYNTVVLAVDKGLPGVDSHVVGFATLWNRGDCWELSTTYVDKIHRRNGIAGMMMDILIDVARQSKAPTLETTAAVSYRSVIVNMLTKRGFQSSGNGMAGDYFLRF